MARYPNQDFHQNVSFKCTLEFRYALKLAMEKSNSRDLSSFIRDHLGPVIQDMLDPLTLADLAELNSLVKIKEEARSHYRRKGCRIVVSAIRFLLAGTLPSLERRVIEISRALRQYETETKKIEDDPQQPVLLRAAMNAVQSDLTRLIKLLDKGWTPDTYRHAIGIAVDLPEDLSLDVSHGLDFLNDAEPAISRAYAVPPRLDPEVAWLHVREEFARERPLLADVITSLEFSSFDGAKLVISAPESTREKITKIQTPTNRQVFAAIVDSYFGPNVEIDLPTVPN
jgi:hypothetical protein